MSEIEHRARGRPGNIQVPIKHPPPGPVLLLVALLGLDPLPGIEAEQVMKTVAPRDEGSFEEVDVHQFIQERLGFLRPRVGKDSGHRRSEVGACRLSPVGFLGWREPQEEGHGCPDGSRHLHCRDRSREKRPILLRKRPGFCRHDP
jgi:hypothetical protein